MFLSGSIKELRMLLDRTISFHASRIYFVLPNRVFIMNETGSYTLWITNLFMSHSMILSRNDILNLQRFFQLAWSKRQKVVHSPYYNLVFDTITIQTSYIEFDRNPEFRFEFQTNFMMLESDSPIVDKMKGLDVSSMHPKHPYLKLKKPVVDQAYIHFRKQVQELDKENRHVNLNYFQYKEPHLAFYKTIKGRQAKDPESILEFDQDYILRSDYTSHRFPIYDVDLRFLRKVTRFFPVETIILIPTDSFYILEGHQDELIFKCHMKFPSKNAS